MAKRKLNPDSIRIELAERVSENWSAYGGSIVRGHRHVYRVADGNRASYKKWEFAVRVPEPLEGGNIEVFPTKHPASKAFGRLPHRAVMFIETTKLQGNGLWYCKVNMSDPSGDKTKVGFRFENRDELKKWIKGFPESIFRRKHAVCETQGNDGDSLVCLVRPENHERMIRLYFAMRVWVLQEESNG